MGKRGLATFDWIW